MKILIAEDDVTSRGILESVLLKWNYEVIPVSNGDDALKLLLGTDAPALALLDWMMPGKNGVQVCQIVRQQETIKPPYLILLTSRGETDDIAKGLESGANDYIIKPYDKTELHARIKVGKRMIKLQDELVEKEKFQGVLETTGAVCHEFNQPLMAISGYSELMMMDLSEDDPNYDVLCKLNKQIHRLGSITKKLMGITQYKTKTYPTGDNSGHIIDIDEASK